ncbi:MAG: hypothetical protein DMG13_28300 [Acidobacteria bacterium]|nr:MAG: hypothetical protein DMG13_28300 [Acidobacteriota bacterium]
MKKANILLLGLALLVPPSALQSSDHADPVNLEVLESGITDLFAFPDGDQMVVILNVRRALTAPPPYQLEPFEFAIYMDLHSKVTVDNKEERARYGGSIPNPEGIKEDVMIKIRLKNDAGLNSVKYDGLQNTDRIKLFTGVRDDPFIFPRFFKRNAIVMVLSIPFASFPNKDQKDWILWGTSMRLKDGMQIDHVGRSNRSQQGRFDFLNTLHPSRHVAAIKAHNQTRMQIEKTLMQYLPPLVNAYQPLFKIRPYDNFPDVMIYTNQYAIGFPNGRKLTDDVAALTCDQGDCALVEGAYIDSPQWPRAPVNDKPFLKEFPYLAEPWPTSPPPAPPNVGLSGALASLSDTTEFFKEATANCCTQVKMALMVTIIVVILIIVIVVWLITRWRYKRANA